MDHLDQGGILFGVGFQEIGIIGLQLGRQVRVANLEADCEAAVAFQCAAFVTAFQGLITFRLARAQDVTQFDRSAALHLLHGRRQLGGSKPTVVLAKIVASSHLLPVATLAGNLDHFLARQIRWTFTVVAGGLALMRAGRPRGGAVLLAEFPFGEAFVFVARFDALVPSAGQWFGAGQSAAERGLEARDGFSLFVPAVAVLGGQHDTGGTFGVRVAVVHDRMRAGVPSGAGFVAGRALRSARHWWIGDTGSTFAGQFVERNAVARLTGTFVAGLVAPVTTAGQHLRAGLRADVVVVDAAFLVALVLGAAAHPSAAFLAAGIVGTGLEELALDLLVHVATTTLDQGGFVARRTLSQVAPGVANVVGTRSTARKLLSTDGLANRDGIQT